MEEQQQRHNKEVYMDAALKPLASDPDNESMSNLSFKSAYTQNTHTQRINEMITQSVKAKKEMIKLSTTICRKGVIWNTHLV